MGSAASSAPAAASAETNSDNSDYPDALCLPSGDPWAWNPEECHAEELMEQRDRVAAAATATEDTDWVGGAKEMSKKSSWEELRSMPTWTGCGWLTCGLN